MAAKYKFVGQSVARVDGVEKVTGKAKFTGDLVVAGMLHGKILRSPYPHARIAAIDTSGAEALAGVAGVITGNDVLDLQRTARGVPVIAVKKVCYQG
ncbi:MAG: xanthine dehydrogenase family protein molybdopterin-binding subunit, partial [Candidatus Binatia bacterium]